MIDDGTRNANTDGMSLQSVRLLTAMIAMQAIMDYKQMLLDGEVVKGRPRTDAARELIQSLDENFKPLMTPFFNGKEIPPWREWARGLRVDKMMEMFQ